jgi:hypothetical protein
MRKAALFPLARNSQFEIGRLMDSYQELILDEASRHAVTAAVADLEDWSRTVAVDGFVELDDLLGVLEILRAASEPQLQSPPTLAAFAC